MMQVIYRAFYKESENPLVRIEVRGLRKQISERQTKKSYCNLPPTSQINVQKYVSKRSKDREKRYNLRS